MIKESDKMWKYFPTGTWNWEGQWVPQWLPEVVSKGRCGSSHTWTHGPFICLAHPPPAEEPGKRSNDMGLAPAGVLTKPGIWKANSGVTGLALVTLHSWQQPDKIPLSSSSFNQDFRHLYECEMKEIRNIYSGKKQKVKGDFARCPVSP